MEAQRNCCPQASVLFYYWYIRLSAAASKPITYQDKRQILSSRFLLLVCLVVGLVVSVYQNQTNWYWSTMCDYYPCIIIDSNKSTHNETKYGCIPNTLSIDSTTVVTSWVTNEFCVLNDVHIAIWPCNTPPTFLAKKLLLPVITRLLLSAKSLS